MTKDEVVQKYIKICKDTNSIASMAVCSLYGLTENTIRYHYKTVNNLRQKAALLDLYIRQNNIKPDVKGEMIQTALKVINKNKSVPSKRKAESYFGFTFDKIDYHFGTYANFLECCLKKDKKNPYIKQYFSKTKSKSGLDKLAQEIYNIFNVSTKRTGLTNNE